MVGLYAQDGTNGAGLRAGVAATYLFIFLYGLGVDVSHSSEVLRAQGDFN